MRSGAHGVIGSVSGHHPEGAGSSPAARSIDGGSGSHNNVDGTARPAVVFNRLHRWQNLIYGDLPPENDGAIVDGWVQGWTHIITRARHSTDLPRCVFRVSSVTTEGR